MDNKTLSVISYITIFGWLFAYITGKDKADDLLRYHLRQSLGINIAMIVLGFVLGIVLVIVPGLRFLGILQLGLLALAVFGIINAANGVEKPVPVLGKMFEKK